MGILKEITINKQVLAKLFANAKLLQEGCVLRVTGWNGRRKDRGFDGIGFRSWPSIYQLPDTSGSYITYKPQFLYLQNDKKYHLPFTAVVTIRWAKICRVLQVPSTKQALRCQFPLHLQNFLQLLLDTHTGNALDKPHTISHLEHCSSLLCSYFQSQYHPSCHEQVWPLKMCPPTILCCLTSSNKPLHPPELKPRPHRALKKPFQSVALADFNPHFHAVLAASREREHSYGRDSHLALAGLPTAHVCAVEYYWRI